MSVGRFRCLLSLFIFFCLLPASTPGQADMKRGYVDTRMGQLHYYVAAPDEPSEDKVPIVLLHAMPQSGAMYRYMLEGLGKDRTAIAFDLPGAGGSDSFPDIPTMANYADAVADAVRGLGYGETKAGRVDFFGFHTGSVVLVEMALRHRDLVRKAMLGGLPLRSKEDQAYNLERFMEQPAIDQDRVEYAWQANFDAREEGVTYDDAALSFAENIRTLSRKYWQSYVAVWSYNLSEQLAKYGELNTPTQVINYEYDVEYEPTLEAHQRFLSKMHYAELACVSALYHPFVPNWEIWNGALRAWFDEQSYVPECPDNE